MKNRQTIILFVILALTLMTGCLKEASTVLFDQSQRPTGTAALGTQKYTNTASVSISLNSSNATEMTFFIDRTCEYLSATEWEPYAASKTIILPPVQGPHTIAVMYRNDARYHSDCQTLEYVLDQSPPTAPPAVNVRTRSTVLTVSALFGFTAASDTYSPIAKYQIRAVTNAGTSLSSWEDVTDLSTITAQSHYISGLTLADGTSYAIEVRAIDSAGNEGPVARSSNFEAGPTLSIAAKYIYAPSGSFAVPVTLSRSLTTPLTLGVVTEDVTTIPGIDFVPASYATTIAAGATSGYASLIMLDPIIGGTPRTFKLKVAESPSAAHFSERSFSSYPNNLSAAVAPSTDSTLVTVGAASSCFVQYATDVRCLGAKNNVGSTYYTETNPVSTGAYVTDLNGGVISKIVSGNQTCTLDEFSEVACWGYNGGYNIGNGTVGTAPYDRILLPYTDVIDISSSNGGTCLVNNLGRVFCWGRNIDGRFGNGGTATNLATTSPTGYSGSDSPTIKPIEVALGANHMCLLFEDGSVRCAGSNTYGALGNGNAAVTSSSSLVATLVTSNATHLFSGESSTCSKMNDGSVKCWGSVLDDLIGVPSPVPTSPTTVALFNNAKRIAMTTANGCMINATDDLYCWGYNMFGQLANPSLKVRLPFTRASNFTAKAADVAMNQSMACATTLSGEVYCWGASDYANGQYQRGVADFYYTAAQHATLDSNVTALRMGYGLSCALKTDHTAWCWGINALNAVDDVTDHFYSVEARKIYDGEVLDVSSGSDHICVVASANKKVYCRGKNTYGQLGDGTTTDSDLIFREVLTLTNVKQISSGPYFTCAVSNDGTVSCWGRGQAGQLGSMVAGNFTSTPVGVPAVPSVASVDAGHYFACAVTSSAGNVYCWGDNSYGQIGNGTPGAATAPFQVPTLTGTKYLAVGSAHVCAKNANNVNYCWGLNSSGQFGSGAKVAINSTPGTSGFTTSGSLLAASEYATCIINDQSLQCAGNNAGGTLGVGSSYAERTTPTTLINLEYAPADLGLTTIYDAPATTALVIGCVLLKYPGASSGPVMCWGGVGYSIGARAKGGMTPVRINF